MNSLRRLMFSLMGTLRHNPLKYLSREQEHLDEVTVRKGWLLVTRSGTVGRVTMCPEEWDGWAASEHIIRVAPHNDGCLGGYLLSFLASPMGS